LHKTLLRTSKISHSLEGALAKIDLSVQSMVRFSGHALNRRANTRHGDIAVPQKVGSTAWLMVWAGLLGGCPLASSASSQVPADSPAAQTTGQKGELVCAFGTYEGLLEREKLTRNERAYYALGMNYAQIGSNAVHARLREAFKGLRFNRHRTPIVMADLESGQLFNFTCRGVQCTREEIARDAPQECIRTLNAPRCLTYAARVDGVYYCTLGPSLNQ
jgi:hypothetical protein